VLVNQWDWNAKVCGRRMPEEMTFADIRRGTDVEFGLSVYEPFGISQLEPLSFGAICVVSNICGCMGFAKRAGGGKPIDRNILEADFLHLDGGPATIDEIKNLPASRRDERESTEAERLAAALTDLLPRDHETRRRRIQRGFELASRMSWEQVVHDYFLPSLDRAAQE